jgi:hypothetical protein
MSKIGRPLDNATEPIGRPQKKPKLTPALYKASITKSADPGIARAALLASDIDEKILLRIKKCLERANHDTTPQPEAKAAFYLASKLMGQYNVSQAEVLAQEPQATQQQYAGQSDVSIERADGSRKDVRIQSFVTQLASAMRKFFDCKAYSTKGLYSVIWTFYGIAENTVAAAMAFEMAFNLIGEWARPYKGIASKSSYCQGVGQELNRMAEKEILAQEKQASETESEALRKRIEEEEAQRKAELDRLGVPSDGVENEDTTSTNGENDEDDSGDEVEPDFAENGDQIDTEVDLDVQIDQLIWPDIKVEIKPELEDSPSLLN